VVCGFFNRAAPFVHLERPAALLRFGEAVRRFLKNSLKFAKTARNRLTRRVFSGIHDNEENMPP
jgi:hypothetical protein